MNKKEIRQDRKTITLSFTLSFALPSDCTKAAIKDLAAKKRLTVALSWTPRTCEVTLCTDFAQATTVRLGAQCQEIALEKDRVQALFFTRE